MFAPPIHSGDKPPEPVGLPIFRLLIRMETKKPHCLVFAEKFRQPTNPLGLRLPKNQKEKGRAGENTETNMKKFVLKAIVSNLTLNNHHTGGMQHCQHAHHMNHMMTALCDDDDDQNINHSIGAARIRG